jgi:uncharacterized membrane protein
MELKRSRNARVMRWALGLSLGVNLLVVGLVAGAAYRSDGPRDGAGMGLRNYGTPYIMALPQDLRREIFEDLRQNKRDRSVTRAARRAQYDEALAALRADPFDQERLLAILDAQREATLGVLQAAQTAWISRIAAMDSEARAAYADSLQEVLERGPKKRRDKEKRPETD